MPTLEPSDECPSREDVLNTFEAVRAKLWDDPGVQRVFEMRSEYQLGDNAAYFLGDVLRIGSPHLQWPDLPALHLPVWSLPDWALISLPDMDMCSDQGRLNVWRECGEETH